MHSGTYITVIKKRTDKLKQEPLLTLGDQLTDKASKAFQECFDRFSKDEKMSFQDCEEFTKTALGNRSQTSSEAIVKALFEEYDSEKKGYLTSESLKTFYLVRARKNPNAVWQNLKNFGYGNDLKFEENSKEIDTTSVNQLPRYILANTPKYFNLLFNLFSNQINSYIFYRIRRRNWFNCLASNYYACS